MYNIIIYGANILFFFGSDKFLSLEILEGYLNTINYGGVYGIESASKYYFDKSASNLSLAEAALLAGIPKSPNNYSPIKNYSKAKERQKIVLTMMKKNKVISEEEYQKALNENITIVGKSKESRNYTFQRQYYSCNWSNQWNCNNRKKWS